MLRRDFLKAGVVSAAATLAAPGALAVPAAPSAKRGCCFGTRNAGWLEKIDALRPSWMYSWAIDRPADLPATVDFTPMIWGDYGDESRAKTIANVAARYKAGEVSHFLTFNEPDQPKQSGVSVDRVLEVWPELMEIGVPLVSPGCVHPDKEWMNTFMDEADRRGYRVDAVAVHSYGGPNAEALVQRLEKVHRRFGKPLWITEFAVGDWQATTAAENRFSADRVAGFMRDVLPALDNLECVHRYAWFSTESGAELFTSKLFDESDKLTPLGEIYRQGKPLG